MHSPFKIQFNRWHNSNAKPFCSLETVIDDENTNVVTAGAIVTVTVTLVRSNMNELFGNADVAEKQSIK